MLEVLGTSSQYKLVHLEVNVVYCENKVTLQFALQQGGQEVLHVTLGVRTSHIERFILIKLPSTRSFAGCCIYRRPSFGHQLSLKFSWELSLIQVCVTEGEVESFLKASGNSIFQVEMISILKEVKKELVVVTLLFFPDESHKVFRASSKNSIEFQFLCKLQQFHDAFWVSCWMGFSYSISMSNFRAGLGKLLILFCRMD
mmetsp:Transcript_7655/g.10567  ORF Transcript_7655/g.10567 Transcript_7655/m.10567 type:complete len:200 (+) Transcript_7655:494-1093(+)